MKCIPVHANKFVSIIYRYTRRYFARELNAFQLEAGQLPFLIHIYCTPGITQEQLSCELGMDKGTTARSVAQLEVHDLVYRVPDEYDRRINHVFPSKSALAVEDELFAILERLNETFFDGFTTDERNQALKFIIRMKDNIEKDFAD